MRIGMISDLHYDLYPEEGFLDTLVQVLAEAKLDVLLNCGDLAENPACSLELLEAIRAGLPALRHYYVPGNHDMWHKYLPAGTSARDVIALHQSRPECVWNETIQLTPEWLLIGGCGWYDYSLGDPKFSLEELSTRSYQGRTWQDKLFAAWEEVDIAVHDAMVAGLAEELTKASGKNVILMTHHINHPRFTVPADRPGREQWTYFNAFLGSKALHNLTLAPEVRIALSGHVHYRFSFDENNTHYANRGLGYLREFALFGGELDLASQIRAAMEIIDI